METILPYVLSLALVPLSLYLISLIRKNVSNATKNLPPGSKGWPLLGENIPFLLSGPEKFFKKRMEEHSDKVFQTSLFGQDLAVFCGAEATKFIFMNESKLVSFWLPQSLRRALGFPEFSEMNMNDATRLTNRFKHDIFKLEILKECIMVMDALAREHLDSYWSTPNMVVKVFPMSKKYTFNVACRLFLNVVDPEQLDKLFVPFNQINDGLVSFPVNLPGTMYNRALKGSKKVREELMRIIKERRNELASIPMEQNNYLDVLSKLLLEGGEVYSDMEICFSIVGLLLASYENASNTMTCVLNYLAQLPHIYEEVYKEQMEIAKSKGPDELLTWKDIEKMKYTWNVVRESLRLIPPGVGAFRETITEFSYAGFTIPKGWKAFWTPYSSHKNPKYFPEPDKFDPSRFEGSGPAPYTYAPFGGGARMCAGKEYARAQILVFIHNVVTRFKLEKAIPNEKIVISNLPKPAYGLPLHLHPHEK